MTIRKASFVVAFVAVVLAFAGPASAQSGSSWGASVDVTPRWEYMSLLNKFIPGDYDFKGKEIRFGLIRGRIRGGDWGVSLVRSELNNSSFGQKNSGTGFSCQSSTLNGVTSSYCETIVIAQEYYLSDVAFLGVEAHKYVPFGTIKRRVQIGMNFGGGMVSPKGSAENHIVTTKTTTRNGQVVDVSQSRTKKVITVKEAFKEADALTTGLTGRFEAIVGVIVTEHLKVKAGGGLNFPGQHKFTIGAAYLF